MRLILLLLVVGFAALGCCEEGDKKPVLACYKGAFSNPNGTRFDGNLELVSSKSCFTYFSTDCSIVLHDENKTNADFTGLFKEVKIEHKADYAVFGCDSDRCNYNLMSQMKQLKDKNNTLYEQCGEKYTALSETQGTIFCYGAQFKGDSKPQNLSILYGLKECYTSFYRDCSIGLDWEKKDKEAIRISCKSDGCNYNMALMMSKLNGTNASRYNECKDTYEKVIKDYKPAPALTSSLMCANNGNPEKSKNSAWDPLEIVEYRPYCRIQFSKMNCLSFKTSFYTGISSLNKCVKSNDTTILCVCTSGDLCNTDIEKWAAEARNLQGSDFMEKCDYTGYNYPQPWRFTPTTEATRIESTTTIVSTIATTPKSSEDQPPASNSVSLSTATSFALLLLMG